MIGISLFAILCYLKNCNQCNSVIIFIFLTLIATKILLAFAFLINFSLNFIYAKTNSLYFCQLNAILPLG